MLNDTLLARIHPQSVARCLLSTQGAPGLKPLLHAGGKNPFSEIKKRRQRFPLWSERFGRQPGRATALSHGHEPQGRATRRAQLAPSPSALPSTLTARFPRPALEMSAEAPRNRPRQLPKTLLGSSPKWSSAAHPWAAPRNAPRQPTPLQLTPRGSFTHTRRTLQGSPWLLPCPA